MIRSVHSALDVRQVCDEIMEVKLCGLDTSVEESSEDGTLVSPTKQAIPKYNPNQRRDRKISATFMSIEQLKKHGEKIGRSHELIYSGQVHEDDIAEVVIVCEPDLSNNVMGSIHPHGALYEKPVNVHHSSEQHRGFREAMRDHGVHCLTVHQILMHNTDKKLRARTELETLAASRLTYTLDHSHDINELTEEDLYFLSEKYKAQVLETMSTEHLIDMIMTIPTVYLKPSLRDTGFTATYQFEPLTNMQYTRDQQITTARGIVMGRLRSLQRQNEVELMRFCFDKLGLEVIGTVKEPGFLEGGDFYPAGKGLCMLGVGLRSNVEAAEQLMLEDLFGTQRVAVVHDLFEQDQARMHLDCIFNILGRDVVVLAEDVIGDEAPLRRLVTEYVRDPSPKGVKDPKLGKYKISREGVEFSRYLKENGFTIIPLSRQQQLEYGCNMLNLGNGDIIACHSDACREVIKSGAFKGNIELVEFGSITAMYGGLHCSSQVVRRRAPT
uniref:Arginine deiminase n=1 Tax=Polyblepharides amylifera TaxID=1486889 RepID=A0A7R9SVT1_9CHLO|mmetsp:Transcript_839/g.1197  ORF Transcript_839/g.1197 Transcript_839/m.1197 type:complete len:497 (+) Transcript_839:136-1626(+)|eukprot:CAMPEP_0196582946 /NCGR_PEP_ID=MMETSP1081-20130531/41370_1 /TAXON_ID=36882 /ORGANISM="Pyramimonas amylifera, Strain CCMP720" /LENGTH=496 /DNA_ID=CAMNT_0041903673 /DNA_START=134 /DNA_END=1624 /DNA_ORIENTATION=+